MVSVCRSLPTPDDPSGGIFVLNRLRGMRKQADVNIVQPLPYMPLVRPLAKWGSAPERKQAEVPIHQARMFYIPAVLKSLDSVWLARAIAPTIEQEHRARRLDLIDAHFGYPEGAGCARVAEKLGIPLFITIRGFENEYVHRAGVGPQMIEAMRKARGCVSVSHSLRKLAMDHGVDEKRIRVVHNAIDWQVFNYGAPAAARARLGLAPDAKLVVSVGHLISRKRHHVLIEAFAKVRERVPKAVLAIAGAPSFEADYPAQLRRKVRDLGLSHAVKFLGNRAPADVVDWLRAADVFALATAREGCCNAILEALACGVPVVTTPVGDNAHFVRNGENGFLAPVDDADALAASMQSALEAGHWERERISTDLGAQVGGWDDVARRVLEFFCEQLEQ
jgi:glycosyltransferase involved in cell wall biosynthesis